MISWQHGGAVEAIRLGWFCCLQGKHTDLSWGNLNFPFRGFLIRRLTSLYPKLGEK